MDELASMQLTAAAGPVAAEGDTLTIAGRTMRSRLVLGSGGFPSLELLSEAVAASGCELVTVALRRVLAGGEPKAGVAGLAVVKQAAPERGQRAHELHRARVRAAHLEVLLEAHLGE